MAVAKKIESLVPKVKREAPSCPSFIAIEELRNTIIDFCINTDIYLADLSLFQTVTGINEYESADLDIPVGSELNHILDFFCEVGESTAQLSEKNLTRLEPKSLIGKPSLFDMYGSGKPKYYSQKDQETILIAPTPNQNYSLYALYSLKPTATATTIPNIIVNEYQETIVHGALYRLQMMKDSPWSDVQAADLNKRMYDKGEAQAVRKTKYGLVGAPLTIKYQEFA
jgi:hypothetical protein|tara:strand:+ start:1511 stop:2188 length:678 start_codon:yes stop_codon:yes gene_type:complete